MRLITLRDMPSSLGYAILALVATKSQSGYDIARQMKLPLGFFWQAKHGQIYPELARLEEAGLVDFEEFSQAVRPPRKVYSATSAGISALTKWAAEAPQERPNNDELIIKAYALRRIPRSSAAELVQAQLDAHQRRLASLEVRSSAIESRNSNGVGLASPRFGDYAALRRAIGSEREYIAWCRWLLTEVMPQTRSKSSPRRRGRSSARQLSANRS